MTAASPLPPRPEPVTVRLYGLVRVTRGQYLVQQVCVLTMLVLLQFVSVAAAPRLAALQALSSTPSDAPWWFHLSMTIARWFRFVPWVLFGLACYAVLETIVVLHRFARKQAATAPPPPAVGADSGS